MDLFPEYLIEALVGKHIEKLMLCENHNSVDLKHTKYVTLTQSMLTGFLFLKNIAYIPLSL